MVSAAICLTALIGCLTVSAERGEGTITVGTVEGKAGDSVTVPVELEYTSSQENGLGIAAALFDVKFDTNVLTITKIEREDPTNDAIAYTVQWRTTDGDESSIDVRDGAVRILAVGKDETAVVPSMSLNLTFTINSEAPAGASNITIENLQACDYGTADIDGIYANDEDMISMSANNGSVTVADDGPVVNPDLALGRTILARDKMGIRFMTVKQQLASYADYYLEIKSQHFVTNSIENPYELTEATDLYTYVAGDAVAPDGYNKQAAEDSNYVYFDYTGITAYEMTLPMDVTIYCLDEDGAVVAKSQTWTFSIASRIRDSQLTDSSADSVYVDLVNYATAVQTYFAEQYPESDLAAHGIYPNEGFEDYQKYATAAVSVDDAVNINEGVATENANGAIVGKGLQIQATNQLYYMIMTGTNDISDLKLKVNYTNSYGSDMSATANVSDMISSSGIYYYYCEEDKNVALFDTAVPVVAELYSGDTLLYTRTYSVESFVAETMATGNATLRNVGDTLMKFTYSLRNALELD